jgi:DNA-binding NtrC family response regulator
MIIGKDPLLLEVLHAAQVVAATDVTALILGESGTGKELLARTMHAQSRRHADAFVSVNCAALPENLAESLLFGHRKGAFTSASADHAGHVGAADHGTLFLDEVAELPLAVQSKLLRFLESGEVLPVGEATPRRMDVRVIAATHRDLRAAVSRGEFREDLYYRLFVVPLQLPPLRERPADIPLLLDALLPQLAARHAVSPPRFTPAALARLKAHAWPGNVRELRNLCERLAVLLPGREIHPENLPAELRAAPAHPGAPGFRLPDQGVVLALVEESLIRQALQRTQGNRSRAARLLGISRDTLLYRLKKFGIR